MNFGERKKLIYGLNPDQMQLATQYLGKAGFDITDVLQNPIFGFEQTKVDTILTVIKPRTIASDGWPVTTVNYSNFFGWRKAKKT